MKKILIIGAGNIGRRHIQSIVNDNKNNYNIHIIDKSVKSLSNLLIQIPEIKRYKHIKIDNNYNNLYKKYNLVIIATTSNDRELIIDMLIDKIFFKYLILEKIVFQKIDSYKYYIKLFKKKKIFCWVNCPNRFYDSFQKIKKLLNKKYPISMVVSGGNWSLGSNFVHYTDLFSFLINEKNFIIDQFEIEEKKIKSKRKNFIEFNGIISIKNNFGSYLTILHNNTKRNLNLKILQNKLSFNLKENNNFAYLSTKKIVKLKK